VPQTRLPWQVSHEYGVVSLQAELHLRDRPDAPALIVTIPFARRIGRSQRKACGCKTSPRTLGRLPVTARLVARDAPGLDRHQRRGGLRPARAQLPEPR